MSDRGLGFLVSLSYLPFYPQFSNQINDNYGNDSFDQSNILHGKSFYTWIFVKWSLNIWFVTFKVKRTHVNVLTAHIINKMLFDWNFEGKHKRLMVPWIILNILAYWIMFGPKTVLEENWSSFCSSLIKHILLLFSPKPNTLKVHTYTQNSKKGYNEMQKFIESSNYIMWVLFIFALC